MKSSVRFAVLAAVAGLAVVAILAKGDGGAGSGEDEPLVEGLPRVIDLGSNTCVPCRMMMQELDRLSELTEGRLAVSFIDIHANQELAASYDIRVIPTQIFLSETGTELWRHEGVISAEDMIRKWAELGYDVATESDD